MLDERRPPHGMPIALVIVGVLASAALLLAVPVLGVIVCVCLWGALAVRR